MARLNGNTLHADDGARGSLMDGVMLLFAFSIVIGIVITQFISAADVFTGDFAVLKPLLLLIAMAFMFGVVRRLWTGGGGRSI